MRARIDPEINVKYVLALAAALVLNACANVLMKLGMKPIEAGGGVMKNGVGGAIKAVLGSPTLLIGLTCFALNAAFYMYALQSRTLKISLAYPIMVGGGFVLIAAAAYLHPDLGERLTLWQKLGVGFVLLGITLIAAQLKTS
jgi:small multidrug resistance pump